MASNVFWEFAHAAQSNDMEAFRASNVMSDSTAAQSMATSSQVYAKNKHIYVNIHHVSELIENSVVLLTHVSSENQPADLLKRITSPHTLGQMIDLLRLEKFQGTERTTRREDTHASQLVCLILHCVLHPTVSVFCVVFTFSQRCVIPSCSNILLRFSCKGFGSLLCFLLKE